MERPFAAYSGREPYVFVSYAHEDAVSVYAEMRRLKSQGFNIWYDEGVKPGATWRDEVALAITQCSVFLLFVTPKSVQSSNCLKEVNFCLSRERKILAVHLIKTTLPAGLDLSLSDEQAIVREDFSELAYQSRLAVSLRETLPESSQALFTITETDPPRRSIAVVPLANRSSDPSNAYLGEGIADELIHGLSRFGDLRVVSAFMFKDQNLDSRLVGEQLASDTVLSGSLQKSGKRVRINIRLDETREGSTLWSGRYDGELEDIFDFQDNVVDQVLRALEVELSAFKGEELPRTGTRNPDAYNAYLLGTHEQRKDTQSGYNEAIEHFGRALELDSDFASAYFQLGLCYWKLHVFDLERDELALQAERAFERARSKGYQPDIPWIELNRRIHPETRPSQRVLAEQACELLEHPDPDWCHYENIQMARCLGSVGMFDSSLGYVERYLNLTLGGSAEREVEKMEISNLLSCLGRFEAAIGNWTQILSIQPNDYSALVERSLLYIRTGQYDKAKGDLLAIDRVSPINFPRFYLFYWQNELKHAQDYFKQLQASETLQLRYKFWAAFLLGDFDAGVDYLERSIARGAPAYFIQVILSRILPQSTIATLGHHPRFESIMTRFGLTESWCRELTVIVNGVGHITGIRVDPDAESDALVPALTTDSG